MGVTEGDGGIPRSASLRRPVQVNSPEDVIALIDRGYCDGVAAEIRATLDGRDRKRRLQVIESVREVFGDEAADNLPSADGLNIREPVHPDGLHV